MHTASILLLVAGFFGVLFVGRMVGRWFRPLTVLGVAAILGGLAVFGGRGATHVEHVRLDDWMSTDGRWIDHELTGDEQSPILWRSESEPLTIVGADLKQVSARKWVLISLGTVLVITGALLAGRGRARPVALKAFTVLGLAAAAYGLVTFVSFQRHTWDNNGDRIVKNDRTVIIGVASPGDDEPSPPPTPPKKPKRPSRAKRPTSRPERHESTEELIAKMPPRAGEIPVAVELAKVAATEKSASEPAIPPSPAVAEPAPVPSPPAAEPAKTPEPVATTDPIKASEEAKAAEPSPAPEPPKAPPTTNVSEPVKDSTPATAAAAPVPAPTTAVDKPAAQGSPLASPPVIARQQSSAERPAWVDAPGKLVDSVYRVSVNSGPYVTVPECQRTLDMQMKQVANQYLEDYLGEGASQVVDIPLGYLRKHVKKAEFNEVTESTVGPMQQIHALLEFDDDARADFQHRWHNAVVGRRLWHVGASTGLILALLATLYGYLRLDLRTGGTHKGQLQLAAALVALIVTAGALLVQSKLPF